MSIRRSLAIARHELRVQRRDSFSIVILFVVPVIMMSFTESAFGPILVDEGYAGATGAEQVVPGMAVMLAFFMVSYVGFAFLIEHGWNTWDRLRASAATNTEIIAGKTAPRLVLLLMQLAFVFTIGLIFLDLDVRGPLLALVPVAFAFSLTLVLLGVALAAVSRTAQQLNSIAMLCLVVFGTMGGAFVPFDSLPGWAQTLAPITPTYWAMRGFQSVILDGGGLSVVLLPTAVLLLWSLACAVIALRRFRFEDTKIFFA